MMDGDNGDDEKDGASALGQGALDLSTMYSVCIQYLE